MSVDYSDSRFDSAVEEIESLLSDLYGIEAAAQAVRDYSFKNPDKGPKTFIPLTLPASTPFEVYPVLPSSDMDPASTYQPWVDAVFEGAKVQAGGIGSWLKAVADNYYLVDAEAITSAAQQQMDLAHDVGVQTVEDFKEVAGNLSVHWEGDAKEAMFEWFADASAVVSILMIYADSAQLSAGAAGDAIGATQQRCCATRKTAAMRSRRPLWPGARTTTCSPSPRGPASSSSRSGRPSPSTSTSTPTGSRHPPTRQ